MQQSLKLLCAFAILFTNTLASAKIVERVAWGEVIDAEPVIERSEIPLPKHCWAARPAASDGLDKLLTWDLQPECVQRYNRQNLGYRIKFLWNGRTYDQIMKKDPGKRVRLRVKIEH